MVAAPKNATALFKGKSGRIYSYNIYFSDVANAFSTWATTGAAGTGSTNFIIAPEDMQLVDISVPTGLTDTSNGVLWLNDAPVPNAVIAWANIVNTLNARSFPPLGISAGRKVQIAQV